MRKLLAAFAAVCLAGSVLAFPVEEIIGYDGDCAVYFEPNRGYFEVCNNQEPIVLGWDFNTITFRNSFREGPRFHTRFGQHYAPHMKFEEKTRTTVRHRDR